MVTMLEQLKFKRNGARSRLLALCLNSGIAYNDGEFTPFLAKRVKKDHPDEWDVYVKKYSYNKADQESLLLYDE